MRGEAIITAIASGRGPTLASGLAFRLGMATTRAGMPIVDVGITMAGVIGSRRLAIRIPTTVTTVTKFRRADLGSARMVLDVGIIFLRPQ